MHTGNCRLLAKTHLIDAVERIHSLGLNNLRGPK